MLESRWDSPNCAGKDGVTALRRIFCDGWPALTPTLSPKRGSATGMLREARNLPAAFGTLEISGGNARTFDEYPSSTSAANGSPSPGGEGWGEGGRVIHPYKTRSADFQFGVGLRPILITDEMELVPTGLAVCCAGMV